MDITKIGDWKVAEQAHLDHISSLLGYVVTECQDAIAIANAGKVTQGAFLFQFIPCFVGLAPMQKAYDWFANGGTVYVVMGSTKALDTLKAYRVNSTTPAQTSIVDASGKVTILANPAKSVLTLILVAAGG